MLFKSDRRSLRLVSHVLGLFALLALISIGLLPAQAAPVSPKVQVLVQPNGTKFEARQWGDERLSGWEMTSGHTILRDKATGNWVYAIRGMSGALEPSRSVVGRDQPPEGVIPHLRPRSAAASAARAAAVRPFPRRGDTPSLGTNNLLAVLVNYSDTQPRYSPEDFNKLLFGRGNNSMAEYFSKVSYGKFTVSAGPAGVRGWYTIDMTAAEVAQDHNKMAFLAVQAADRDGVDFSAYDMDGDCDADTVAIIHQGGDQPSYASNLGNYGPYLTRSPCRKGGFVTVHNYITVGELFDYGPYIGLHHVGVIIHEYGHVLGLPDLYDINYTSNGVGQWSTMSHGLYNCSWEKQNGQDVCVHTPVLLDAFSRLVLNWSTPIVIERGAAPVSVTLPPTDESPSVVLFGSGEPLSEYFIVENRQKSGFDAGLPGSGLLVWHVDDAVEENWNECAHVLPGDCASGHQKVTLVQADGRWDLQKSFVDGNAGDDGDPFPGAKNITSIDDDTKPFVRLYSGARSGISISSITQSGKNITAIMSHNPQFNIRYSTSGTGKGAIAVTGGSPPQCVRNSCTVEFKQGEKVTLTATPAPGSVFKGWTGAGCSGTGSCTVTMSSDQQVTATFEELELFTLFSYEYGSGEGRLVITPQGASSTCNESKICDTRFGVGTTVTLTAEPAAGSLFAGWTQYIFRGDETDVGSDCGETNTCTVTMSTHMYVSARFEKAKPKLLSLTLQKDGTGGGAITRAPLGSDEGCSTGSSACQVQYEEGATVTLTATASAGSVFAGWSGTGGCSGTGTCTLTMSAARSVTATFNALRTFVLTYRKTGTGSGAVTFSPRGSLANCTANCTNSFASGTVVTVTAAAEAGSAFAGWSGIRGCSGTGPCTVTMTRAMSLKASFRKLPIYALNYTKAGKGAGTVAFSPAGQVANCAGRCTNRYVSGTVVTLTATPQPGSAFLGWSGN
ncbi:M6 family metalloprotease domain-containing protein, partial [Aestuariivirga sp.]|uniref:InlB B-repeat-containing protein n=1 Tax=Aestuariivirga sp. TaxID=2650926 RepID=UPI003784B6D6